METRDWKLEKTKVFSRLSCYKLHGQFRKRTLNKNSLKQVFEAVCKDFRH